MAEYGFFGFLWESSLIIKGVFFLLFGMSLSTWSLIFYKCWIFSQANKNILEMKKNINFAQNTAGKFSAGVAHTVMQAGLSEKKRLQSLGLMHMENGRFALESIRYALHDTAATENERLYGSLSYLSTCATVAPLLGLFGTVWGIMSSFSSITGSGLGVAEVAPGLAEALGTTAVGLMVAIPAVLAYKRCRITPFYLR